MKKIFGIFIIIILFSVIPVTNAQLTIGVNADQKSIELYVDKSEIIEAKHTINSSKMPVSIKLFEGVIENSIEAINPEGKEKDVGISKDSKGNVVLTIFPSNNDTIIKYNINDKSSLFDNLWTIRAEYNETYAIIFSEEIEYIFLNNNFISLENKKGVSINQGGNVIIQYYSIIPKLIQEVRWEENKFDVSIFGDSKINKFYFDQTSKSISFEINEKNKFITVEIPVELLGGPFVVLLDDEKIKYDKSFKNENNVILNIKPESSGQITIIGTTVIPEFSMFIPLIMGFMIILTVPLMRKFSLR